MTTPDLRGPEGARLDEDSRQEKNWKRWGPYLSERQWGTVREDYSPDGTCWTDFPHDQARSRAYRWGEDGLLGITDRECRMCFSLALWNGRDPILKERLFGLTGPEGNHGEDVKELYYYLDSTPTHSYLKALYKYPQAEFPYANLVAENRRRSRNEPEFELVDTGAFDDNRYFDVEASYAKAGPNDVCIRLTLTNRGPERDQGDPPVARRVPARHRARGPGSSVSPAFHGERVEPAEALGRRQHLALREGCDPRGRRPGGSARDESAGGRDQGFGELRAVARRRRGAGPAAAALVVGRSVGHAVCGL
jgi:hypothetical protein